MVESGSVVPIVLKIAFQVNVLVVPSSFILIVRCPSVEFVGALIDNAEASAVTLY